MIAITSDYGIGKTTFALECGYEPKDMIFVNDDVKETGFESQFGQYVNLIPMSKGMTILDFHNQCIKMIDKMKKHKVIIWDTWTQFANTLYFHVVDNPDKFRTKRQYAGTSAIVAGRMYQDAYRLEGTIISTLKSKCDLLILTFHLAPLFIDNVAIPDRYKPGHDKAISKYADLRIWLTPNPDSQMPTGLVMKNISKRTIEKGKGIRTKQVLPLRLERCNWDTILNYWKNPIGDAKRGEMERPNEFELSLISGTLTPENKRMYQAGVVMAKISERAEDHEQVETIKAVLKNMQDAPIPVKVQAIRDMQQAGELAYNGEINGSKITEWSR